MIHQYLALFSEFSTPLAANGADPSLTPPWKIHADADDYNPFFSEFSQLHLFYKWLKKTSAYFEIKSSYRYIIVKSILYLNYTTRRLHI